MRDRTIPEDRTENIRKGLVNHDFEVEMGREKREERREERVDVDACQARELQMFSPPHISSVLLFFYSFFLSCRFPFSFLAFCLLLCFCHGSISFQPGQLCPGTREKNRLL
ncbi:unnamed protein product [Penicillium salamii]|nr:unnamed protein product [Penicillium salamii]CAG8050143.1 unnamed protein product [Penicillium salamii]CAG8061845.1 unnamed protein product [Penicillium salamii]CAG8230435.1 unnamed protein product [Penicillium salamii]CAG8273412.1 unnamed protein product [Penicillium salamii]